MIERRSSARRSRPSVEHLELRALLSAGGLDATYGGTGQVFTKPSYPFFTQGLAVQADLKTVVVGTELSAINANYPFTSYPRNTAIVRYNANGSLDASFGSGGTVLLPTNSVGGPAPTNFHLVSVAVQPDGKLVVATNTTTYTYTAATKKASASYTITSANMEVFRLNSDGSLDGTFGGGGKAVIAIPGAFEVSGGVALMPDGRIVVAGTNLASHAGLTFAAARLTSGGALDATFGGGKGYVGLSTATASSLGDGVSSLGVDASGNVLVGGGVQNASAPTFSYQVVRYTSAGVLDASFASRGVFSMPGYVFKNVDAIAFTPAGKILLGIPLLQPAKPGIVQLNADGTVDAAFGNGGSFGVPNAMSYDGLAVQPDGKVLLSVLPLDANGNVSSVQVDRLLPGGTLDPSFGAAGVSAFALPPNTTGSFAVGLVVGPDGKITGGLAAEVPLQFGEAASFRLLNDIASGATTTATPSGGPSASSTSPVQALDPGALFGTPTPGGRRRKPAAIA
ncbi:hypothetical protein OJF2_02840 [Aquisphaera giovannonii]|uniref:Delta-60 repeat domain protein n=1 Tax=Aquisphaera giovannonii TaxID=406548 RepID=A0A5B9VUN8_9BACT|nr:hypothetical protein [Aquisphaera giovannonii]QEH31819.1 hypothetical protein OJF2_02840 [Aquisphaera giovannonii]